MAAVATRAREHVQEAGLQARPTEMGRPADPPEPSPPYPPPDEGTPRTGRRPRGMAAAGRGHAAGAASHPPSPSRPPSEPDSARGDRRSLSIPLHSRRFAGGGTTDRLAKIQRHGPAPADRRRCARAVGPGVGRRHGRPPTRSRQPHRGAAGAHRDGGSQGSRPHRSDRAGHDQDPGTAARRRPGTDPGRDSRRRARRLQEPTCAPVQFLELQTEKLKLLTQQHHTAQERLNRRLVAIYQSDSPDTVEVVLTSESLADVLDQFDYMRDVGRQDKRIAADVREARLAMKRTRARTARTRKQVAATTAAVEERVNEQRAVRDRLVATRARSRRPAPARTGCSRPCARRRPWTGSTSRTSRPRARSSR